MAKIGRNQPCRCQSGKKYKKCCGRLANTSPAAIMDPMLAAAIEKRRKEVEAEIAQRQKQQGRGRGIISNTVAGHRVVCVGSKVYWSQNWVTFHDFLREYLIHKLDAVWFRTEAAKPAGQQHAIVRWYDLAVKEIKRSGKSSGQVFTAPMIGAHRAFLNLAYNIYLIDHHADPTTSDKLVNIFIRRLKSTPHNFVGVLFETYAAAAFLKAGFDLAYEKESDGSKSHVEFIATYPATGRKFSVEVKTRNRTANDDGPVDNIKRLRVASKLNQALAKEATHDRVVIIELNLPDVITDEESLAGWPQAALEQVRYAEKSQPSAGETKPSAYVLITNHAYHNNLPLTTTQAQLLAIGFNIPDFGPDVPYPGAIANFW